MARGTPQNCDHALSELAHRADSMKACRLRCIFWLEQVTRTFAKSRLADKRMTWPLPSLAQIERRQLTGMTRKMTSTVVTIMPAVTANSLIGDIAVPADLSIEDRSNTIDDDVTGQLDSISERCVVIT